MTASKTQILNSIPDNSCCSHAFLSSILLASAQIIEDKILIGTKQDIIKKIKKVIANFYKDLEFNSWENFLYISGNTYELIKNHQIDNPCALLDYYPNECDKLTIVKTLFLTNGNFYYNSDDTKNSKGYNLEFSIKNKDLIDVLHGILQEYGLDFKLIKRLSTYVLYTKNSNVICDFLVKVGATYTALEIQNMLAVREIRNTTNRQNNCFEFNLDKTLSSSHQQLEAINYIIDRYSIDYFEENLKEVALARIANPDVSLNDLRKIMNNKISRAGIKYRLDKIISIYDKLKGAN